MRKQLSLTTFAFFSILLLTIGMGSRITFAVQAAVYIDPAEVTGLSIGDIFTVNITVANVSRLAGWEFKLYYSSQVLRAINYSEGPFLKRGGSTIFVDYSDYEVMGIYNEYNATHGRVWLACGSFSLAGVSGAGTLASVTFQVKGAGYSVLSLPEDSTKLSDPSDPPVRIPATATAGLVSIIGHDVAVINMNFSKTVTSGTLVTINVTVANLGNYSASFNTTLYYNSTEIATQTATNVPASTELILTFTWDITQVPKGNYTISAYIPPLAGENNVENNQLVDGWIKKTILGDVNGDGRVNIIDVTKVAKAWQARPGDARWDPDADIDENQVINIVDITKVATEFGKTDP